MFRPPPSSTRTAPLFPTTTLFRPGGAALAARGNINVDLSGLSGSAGGARATELFTKSLAVPLALVVLLACFLTALSSPMKGVSLIGLGDAVAELEGAARMASMKIGRASCRERVCQYG